MLHITLRLALAFGLSAASPALGATANVIAGADGDAGRFRALLPLAEVGCDAASLEASMQPFVEAHDRAFVAYMVKQSGCLPYESAGLARERCCLAVVRAALAADATLAATLMGEQLLRGDDNRATSEILQATVGTWPSEALAATLASWLADPKEASASVAERIMCELAGRSWPLAEPFADRFLATPEARSGLHDLARCASRNPQPEASRFFLRLALAAPAPHYDSAAFGAYLDCRAPIAEAEALLIAVAGHCAAALGEDQPHQPTTTAASECLDLADTVVTQLRALGTETAIRAANELADAQAGRSRRYERDAYAAAMPERALYASPLLLLSAGGVAQMLAWRSKDRPTRARSGLATANTAVLGGLVGVGLGAAVAFLVSAPSGGGGQASSGEAMSGLLPIAAAAVAGVAVGGALMGGGAYLGYRQRENRTFYMTIAITETVWPLLAAAGILAP